MPAGGSPLEFETLRGRPDILRRVLVYSRLGWRRGVSYCRAHVDTVGDGAGLTGATRLRPPGLLELEELLEAFKPEEHL